MEKTGEKNNADLFCGEKEPWNGGRAMGHDEVVMNSSRVRHAPSLDRHSSVKRPHDLLCYSDCLCGLQLKCKRSVSVKKNTGRETLT